MELNFVQSSEVFGKNTLAWVTEFEVTRNFNLHVERNKGGNILVYQRTSGSGYAIVEEFRGMDNKPAIDLEFTGEVYPKFVKIVSESQPTYATVTTDGEITEIKSQSKEVEVTANGTMDITPDAGFSYLNSVKVKTNVPQSGEGGGSASDVYVNFDVPDITPGELITELVVGMPIIEVAYKDKDAGYTLLQGNTAVLQYCQDPSLYDNATELIGFHFSGQIMTPDGLVNVLDYILSIFPLPAKPISQDKFYNTEEK